MLRKTFLRKRIEIDRLKNINEEREREERLQSRRMFEQDNEARNLQELEQNRSMRDRDIKKIDRSNFNSSEEEERQLINPNILHKKEQLLNKFYQELDLLRHNLLQYENKNLQSSRDEKEIKTLMEAYKHLYNLIQEMKKR